MLNWYFLASNHRYETRSYQFSTSIHLNNALMETSEETKFFGSIVRSDLSWLENSKLLTQKAYQRMTILIILYEFDILLEDLVQSVDYEIIYKGRLLEL